jgi:hypothetical protein
MIGITLGYILYQNKNTKIEISKALNSALWIISLSLLLIVVFTTFLMSKVVTNKTTLISNALYVAFHRFVWAGAICWIIFACQTLKTGNEKFKDNFMKFGGFFFFFKSYLKCFP